jgi:hypothetical protein
LLELCLKTAAVSVSISFGTALAIYSPTAIAGDLSLEWDASPSSNVGGYRVYYGLSSGTYPNPPDDVGDTTTYILSDLVSGQTYFIAVTAYDDVTGTLESVFSNEVSGTADAPTALALAPTAVDENVPPGTTVGTFTTTDPNTGDTFTYTLVVSDGNTDNTAFTIVGNALQVTASPDFETQSSYAIRVRTTDQGGLFIEQDFTVTINGLNEAPTAIAPTSVNVAENTDTSSGLSVATLGTTDIDAGETFSYAIQGGADAASFAIGGAGSDELMLTAGVLDFETQGSYVVVVRVTDSGANTRDETITVNVNPSDSDGDGIIDIDDNCPSVANPSQTDTDGDGQGDACDADDDNDGVQDTADAFPLDAAESVDTDGDGMGDVFENRFGLNPNDPNDAGLDGDADGSTNLEEFRAGMNPNVNETGVMQIINVILLE